MGIFNFSKKDESIKIFKLACAGYPFAVIDLESRTVTFKAGLTRSHKMSLDEVTSISVAKTGLLGGVVLIYANAVVVYEIECYPDYDLAKQCMDFIKGLQGLGQSSVGTDTKLIPVSRIESLERLQKLREQGVLSDEEFAEEKKKILAA